MSLRATDPPVLPASPGRGAALLLRYGAASLAGVGLLVFASQRYRIDRFRCATLPPAEEGALYGLSFALALVLLSIGWLGLVRLCKGRVLGRPDAEPLPLAEQPCLRYVLIFGGLVHGVALLAAPFLSDDPLAYAAVGRAMRLYHQGMYVPLGVSLPLSDEVRQAISSAPSWLSVGSAYSPGFNWLASGIIGIAGRDLTLTLRLMQLVGLIAAVLSAAVAGHAARLHTRTSTPEAPASQAEQAAARAAALILLCPLTLIEATVSAHNDSLLMLSVAFFCLFCVQRRPAWALLALALALVIKASALLLVALYGGHLVLARLRIRFPALGRRFFVGAALVGGAALLVLLWGFTPWLMRYLSTVARLLGSPADPLPYCTHSLECLPRGILHVPLGMKTASWLVGLGFRCAAGVWFLSKLLRRETGPRYLGTMAGFLFIYYLYFHASCFPWYLLSLLPLLPYAPRRLLPAMLVFSISSLAHYVMDFSFSCSTSVVRVGFSEVVEGLLFVAPPSIALARARAQARARRSCPSLPIENPRPAG